MKENSFNDKTTAQLQSNLYLLKAITIALSIVIILLLSITIYGMVTKENNGTFVALFGVAISCGAILPLQFMNMKNIKAELASRL
ncbi:hypothetical protein [uncultured Polaribacter sp.]|uniref:hypothetical protein n=1 Tax=uncultured Polaribacter sp. TaxID=174711 RepID=UPI00261E576C|nr:hypothetical protein [uncultured Polaribacter sp.]